MAEAQGRGSAHASRLRFSPAKLRETFCNPFANASLVLRFNTDIYSKIRKVCNVYCFSVILHLYDMMLEYVSYILVLSVGNRNI